MEDRLWSIEEVARWSNVSVSTVRRWVSSGKLVGEKVGSQWRFDPNIVREAFRRGALSKAVDSQSGLDAEIRPTHVRDWAKPTLARWSKFVKDLLEEVQPDHVIANDRRGAKIWKLIMPNRYSWGKNLWHSTALEMMEPSELRQIFGRRRVLLFDEMMQHGREMHELREFLESKDIQAIVTSIACIRRNSCARRGELLEYKALYCEDLDDVQFAERAALISRMVYLFEPPLDVDHLVVKGTFRPGLTMSELLENAAKWGIPYVVWVVDQDHELMAITLDRPQFFKISGIELPSSISLDWSGPLKIRIYGNFDTSICYCSFISFPEIKVPLSELENLLCLFGGQSKQGSVTAVQPKLPYSEADSKELHRAYSIACSNLAIKLFDDFVASGAAKEMGVSFEDSRGITDVAQLRATFGPTMGSEIERRVRQIQQSNTKGMSLFEINVENPIPLLIRENTLGKPSSHDVFECRTELLRAIPQRYLDGQQQEPIPWSHLIHYLTDFSESTIGRALDDDLDTGAAKPINWISPSDDAGNQVIQMKRCLCRGEFGPWFEWDRDVYGHKDIIIQRTLGLGPMVVEKFLEKTGGDKMTATHFNKAFANLEHDLREGSHDLFYLGWRPYKYGPVPVVPVESPTGEYMELHQFLTKLGCLKRTKEKHGSSYWDRYEAADESAVPWRDLYKTRTSAVTRAHIAGLTRLYATIMNDYKSARSQLPESPAITQFQDPLVILATARNEEIMYQCGWFEVDDWRAKGELLFALLGGISTANTHPSEPYLRQFLEEFAAPAALLQGKIQMYRNLPYLRERIVNLIEEEGNLEAAEVLLEKVDSEPRIESETKYPIKNLEWGSRVMRAFSSMTRQVLTEYGFDIDTRRPLDRVDVNGVPKDGQYYLNELLGAFPEVRVLEEELLACMKNSSSEVRLTEKVNDCLSKAFEFILHFFYEQRRIPDRRPQGVRLRGRDNANYDLPTVLREIQFPQPYAIAVADIWNIRGMSRIGEIMEIEYDDAFIRLLNYVKNIASRIVKSNTHVQFECLSSDCVIFVGSNVDKIIRTMVQLMEEITRKLSEIDRIHLGKLGLLRTGIAWRDDSLGSGYQGIRPGILAHDLANIHKQELGAINITSAVCGNLSNAQKESFEELRYGGLIDSIYDQGRIYVRYTNLEV